MFKESEQKNFGWWKISIYLFTQRYVCVQIKKFSAGAGEFEPIGDLKQKIEENC